MTVNADVYRKAIDVIRERGWSTGTLGEDYYHGAVCINGALMEAQGLSKNYTHYNEGPYKAVAREIARTLKLDNYYVEERPALAIESWNDSAATEDAVIDALERTAQRLEQPTETFSIYYDSANLPISGRDIRGTKYRKIQVRGEGHDAVDAVQRLMDQFGSIYRGHDHFMVTDKNAGLWRVNVSNGRASAA